MEAITNTEKYLAAIAGAKVTPPKPTTNIEVYLAAILNKISGGSGVIEPLTITENGTYEAPEGVDGYSPVVVNVAGGGGGEKILYMDAALLSAGGAYPVDADDYTTAVIPAEATFVSLDAFANLPYLETLIVNGDCEFEVYSEYAETTKSYVYYNAITSRLIPIRKLIVNNRVEIPSNFMTTVGPLLEIAVTGSVGDSAFEKCTYLKKATLENCLSIGVSAFNNCTAMTEIIIPAGVTSIGVTAFYNCKSMTKVTIPDGVTTIGSKAFQYCTALTVVALPDSLNSIGDYAFRYCTNLTTITYDGTVDEWYAITLSGDWNNSVPATKVVCTDGVVYLNTQEFIVDADNRATIGYTGEENEELVIPASFATDDGTAYHVGEISFNAFLDCTNLANVTIPSTVHTIGASAFSGCTGLTEVTIKPADCIIGADAFSGCTNLETITILGMETTIYGTTETIPTTTTIRGYTGSAAETFATTNGYTFEAIA